MKKLLLALILLATPAFADTCATSLMPAFNAYQATNLCKTFASAIPTSLVPSADNTYDLGSTSKTWRTLYTGTSIIAKTSQILRVQQDANRLFTFDGSSDTALTFTFGDGSTTALQAFVMSGSGADADDDTSFCVAGGGACTTDGSRGAFARFRGNEFTGAGDIDMYAGSASGSVINMGTLASNGTITFQTGAGTTAIVLDSSQNATFSGQIFGSVANKSWANGLSAVPADVTTISTPQALLFNGSGGGAGLITAQGANDANGTNNSFLKSRATDGSADTIVQSGDIISLLTFYGANGTTFDTAARIKVTVGGTPGASNDMPGKIEFQTSPDGSSTLANVLTLDQDKSATFTGVIKSTATNVGWQIRSGANTACNTTCTASHGCLFGQDTGSSNIAVDCTDAAADVCVCSF